MKRIFPSLLLCLSTFSYAKVEQPQNIIMIVGDGMGPAYTSAYRYFKDDPTTKIIEETVFDRHLVGMSSTYPASVSGYVTDSAAAATALSTGVKTYNGAIGVNKHKQPLTTVLERAKNQGKKIGVVVTSQINHATPASYLTHNESRKNYNEIADSYLDNGIKADVYLGGGWQYFIREDRNLVNEFKSAGFQYIDNYESLNNIDANKPLFGLFDDKGLPWALDDKNKHRLAALTKVATKHLENKQGYFMLIEASQIDWAGHSNDIASAMAEMDDLGKTLEYLEGYVKENPNTLVVLTADHSTGGFTIGKDSKYEWQPDVLKTMKMSPLAIAKKLSDTDFDVDGMSALFNFRLSADEVIMLAEAKVNGIEKITSYDQLDDAARKSKRKPLLVRMMYKAVNKIIDDRTNTGWTSGGHTGIDVPVYALGQQSDLFNGHLDNTDIAKKIFKLLGEK